MSTHLPPEEPKVKDGEPLARRKGLQALRELHTSRVRHAKTARCSVEDSRARLQNRVVEVGRGRLAQTPLPPPMATEPRNSRCARSQRSGWGHRQPRSLWGGRPWSVCCRLRWAMSTRASGGEDRSNVQDPRGLQGCQLRLRPWQLAWQLFQPKA